MVEAAVQWAQENFKNQQWDGSGWAGRKKESRRSRGKPLLVGRRDMYNAIRVLGPDTFGVVGIPYARIHNEGGTITHPARTRRTTFKRYNSGKRKGKVLFHENNSKATFSKQMDTGCELLSSFYDLWSLTSDPPYGIGMDGL